MGKFNKTQKTETVINLASGKAYKQSKELELASLLLTQFISDSFYRKTDDSINRIRELLGEVDPLFAAKAAIFARDRFGMRSVTHVLAAELAPYLSGKPWGKNFYRDVVVRPDDMTEIVSYYQKDGYRSFPNALKRGFAQAFDKFDDYQIAKYKSSSKSVKLVDIVNLVHPKPTESNKTSLKALVDGSLKNEMTWESMLSKAGQVATSDEELADLKSNSWKELLESKRLGYFAALRNMRNILEQSPESVPNLIDLLTNVKMIEKSRVLPFRFKTAYDEISKLSSNPLARDLMGAISDALDHSVANVPKMEDLLVVLDVSGSMRGNPSDIASLFGAILAKANNCDVMTFSTSAKYVDNYNRRDSVLTIQKSFNFSGGGTNFQSIFKVANKPYKNIIILSDMQAWVHRDTPKEVYKSYKSTYGVEPNLFSWDLSGLGTLQFPEKSVFCLSGFSDKVFDVMGNLIEGNDSLTKMIRSIEI